jgi:hypothetical protein
MHESIDLQKKETKEKRKHWSWTGLELGKKEKLAINSHISWACSFDRIKHEAKP